MFTTEDIHKAFDGFKNLKALIIGDVMIDAYFWGSVDRISPEAPVPVVAINKRENRMGGAANVALNIQALGATPVLCSVIGNDQNGKAFTDLMNEANIPINGMLALDGRTTTVKTRIISQNQQMLRIDEEMTSAISKTETENLYEKIAGLIDEQEIGVIIFEDYDKGVITPELIKQVVKKAKQHGIPTTVDPKKENFLDYHGVTLFKPNLKELREGLKIELAEKSLETLNSAFDLLKAKMPIEKCLITLSELGVYYNEADQSRIFPAHLRKIADVSGAGDTVISVASLCLAMNFPLSFSSRLANLAGGLVCEKVGVVPIEAEQLLKEAVRLSR